MEFSVDNEDIHMNIETLLTQRIGDAGKRLHTARSRNDQVAVDTRLYVKEEIPVIISMILDLEQVLEEKAREHTDTVMPGYIAEGKPQLSIAIGCTGGQHRSVAIAEATARYLEGAQYHVSISHRDLSRANTKA